MSEYCTGITSQGVKFFYDPEDEELVRRHTWVLSKRGYIITSVNRKKVCLHRMLIPADRGFDIDHINGDKLDNRRCNLRVCTHQQNTFNQKCRCTNTSGYMGVSKHKAANKYEAYINLSARKIYLGLYETAEEAARVRDRAALFYYGEFANLNFKGEGDEKEYSRACTEIHASNVAV